MMLLKVGDGVLWNPLHPSREGAGKYHGSLDALVRKSFIILPLVDWYYQIDYREASFEEPQVYEGPFTGRSVIAWVYHQNGIVSETMINSAVKDEKRRVVSMDLQLDTPLSYCRSTYGETEYIVSHALLHTQDPKEIVRILRKFDMNAPRDGWMYHTWDDFDKMLAQKKETNSIIGWEKRKKK